MPSSATSVTWSSIQSFVSMCYMETKKERCIVGFSSACSRNDKNQTWSVILIDKSVQIVRTFISGHLIQYLVKLG